MHYGHALHDTVNTAPRPLDERWRDPVPWVLEGIAGGNADCSDNYFGTAEDYVERGESCTLHGRLACWDCAKAARKNTMDLRKRKHGLIETRRTEKVEAEDSTLRRADRTPGQAQRDAVKKTREQAGDEDGPPAKRTKTGTTR